MNTTKNMLSVLSVAIAFLAASPVRAETLTVPANTEVMAEASANYDAIVIDGKLTVPSGVTVTGDVVTNGNVGAAQLIVDGGTFGKITKNDPYFCIGYGGGSAKISLINGGTFYCGDTKISANTTTDASGYIDYLTVDGTSTLTCRDFYNYASVPARVRILSGTATFASAGGASYYHYRKGAWVFDVAQGAQLSFSAAYRASERLLEGNTTTVTFTGAGDVGFTGSGSNNTTIPSGTSFENSGAVRQQSSGRPLVFSDGVVFADSVSGLRASGPVKFNGNVNLGDITSTSETGLLNGPDSGTTTITLGRNDRSSTITGAAFAANTTLVLDKVGAGELTVSATTPYLPALAVDGGSVRIQGAFSCAGMTLAAGTSVVVDGGVWTIEGAQLTQAAGATITTANKGNIILKVTDGATPTFAAGTTIDVLEYWVNGVQQANGSYTCGGATVKAYKYSEDGKTVWTNEGKTGASYAFSDGEEYKGFALVKADAPLAFTGGPVILGSSGIVVDDAGAATPTFDFDLPVMPVVNQTWNFGSASASFHRPLLLAKGVADDPQLKVYSGAALEFATTNSTFVGTLTASGRTIRVSGPSAFGAATAVSLRVDRKTFTDAFIELRDVTTEANLTLRHDGGSGTAQAVRFKGENTFGGSVSLNNARYSTCSAGSVTRFNGGASYYDYSVVGLWGNAKLTYGNLNLAGYAGSRCLRLSCQDTLYDATVRFEGDVSFVDTTEYDLYFNGITVEMGKPYAFTEGLVSTDAKAVIDLNGNSQRLTQLLGSSTVTSSAPAFLEIATPGGTWTNLYATFTGQAGLKLVGAGELKVKKASEAAGSLAVTNGTLTLEGAWPNATSVTVSGSGTLDATAVARPFGKQVDLSLAGTGGLALAPGSQIRVGRLTLTDPATGEVHVHTDGTFDSTNSYGLLSGGSVRVGKVGMVLIFR